jgi:sulfur carrier protein ThiS
MFYTKLFMRPNKNQVLLLVISMKKTLLVLFLTFYISSTLLAQTTYTSLEQSVLVKKGKKYYDLNEFNGIDLVQYVVRNNQDSLRIEIHGDSISKSGDTLFIRPWSVDEYRYVIDNKPSSSRIYYDHPTTTMIKIPIKEIASIKMQRQPFCFMMSSLVAASILGTFAGIAISSNTDNSNHTGDIIAISSYATWVVSLSARLAWGNIRMKFDPTRTHKKVWIFE